MTIISPAAVRAVQIVGFLSAHPTEAFTLSDLCRRLDLNRASADRVVRALTSAGFLERHPRHLTYSLGISLVAIGHAAAVRHPVVEAVRREMQILSNDLGLQCNAMSVDDTGSLVVAETGHGLLAVGTRFPPLPMMGLVHRAFMPDERRRAWLESMPFDRQQIEFLDKALTTIAERGFATALRGPVRERIRGQLTRLIEAPRDEAALETLDGLWRRASEGELQLLDIEEGTEYDVAYVSAPVFGPNGGVALEMVIRNPPSRISGRDLDRLAERLREACATVTRQIHGRAPVPESAASRSFP
jgi:DNA-binding IclR family transcriptional regulator